MANRKRLEASKTNRPDSEYSMCASEADSEGDQESSRSSKRTPSASTVISSRQKGSRRYSSELEFKTRTDFANLILRCTGSHRCLRDSMEANQSLKGASDSEDSCADSGGSGRNSGCPPRTCGTVTSVARGRTDERVDEIAESRAEPVCHDLEGKGHTAPPKNSSKAVCTDCLDSKTDTTPTVASNKFSDSDEGNKHQGIPDTDDVIGCSAVMMSARESALDDGVAVSISSEIRSKIHECDANSSSNVNNSIASPQFPPPAAIQVSAFANRLLAHAISADPTLEAVRSVNMDRIFTTS